MEIIEIISHFINDTTDTLDVRFRMNEDEEDELRIDEIDLMEARDFGYSLLSDDYGFYDDDYDDENGYVGERNVGNIDEHDLISFLNEYYMVYPNRIPEKEIY